MDIVRTAVIGVGHFGKLHAQKYAEIENADLVAVVDTDSARAAEIAARHGARAVTDYRDLIGQVDAVSITVPTTEHHKVAKFFLENGVHLLVEKPITSDVDQADDLIRCARARNLVLQVGHLERFFAANAGLLDEVTRPLYIEAVRISPFGKRGNDVSVVHDLMIHDIDLINALVQSPVERVDAVGTPVLTNQIDIVNTRLHFQNGCVATITASRVSQKSERQLRIFQADCVISVDLLKRQIKTVRKTEKSQNGDTGAFDAGGFSVKLREVAEHDALLAEIASFTNAVATGGEPLVTGEDGREALAIGNRIIDSLQAHAAAIRDWQSTPQTDGADR